MKLQFYFLLTAILVLLTACGGPTATSEAQAVPPSPTATDPATATPEQARPPTEPTATSTLAPTATATATTTTVEIPTPAEDEDMSAIETANWLEVEGKTEDGYTYLGNPDAPVTMIDYSDFLWSQCRAYVLGAEPQIRENYVAAGQLRILFSPMLDLGPNSTQAAIAAECAGEQGQYWNMHDLLFANQRDIFRADTETFQTLAGELDLDPKQFGACLAEQRYADLVQSQDQTRRQRGIRTHPTFDINGQLLVGARSFDAFQSRIDPLLAQ